MAKESKTIYQKLLDAQKEIKAIKKEEDNPYFNSKYFTIDMLLEEVKPILNNHGLVVLQPLTHIEESAAIKTIIIDAESGERLEDVTFVPENPDPQKMGSAYTYYRRYSLSSFLGIEGESDDDGNTASGNQVAQNPPPQASKAWRKVKEKNYGVCNSCGAVTERAIGVSKQGKKYNVATCTADKRHKPTFLDIDEQEFENTLSF